MTQQEFNESLDDDDDAIYHCINFLVEQCKEYGKDGKVAIKLLQVVRELLS